MPLEDKKTGLKTEFVTKRRNVHKIIINEKNALSIPFQHTLDYATTANISINSRLTVTKILLKKITPKVFMTSETSLNN